MLYDVQSPQIEASLDLTTNDDRCYKYLPVITGQPPAKRFLIPGSRLLSNISETESCEAAKKVPRGYLTTEGYWVAACPREKILSPPTELQIEVLTTPDTYENEAKGGAYMDRDLAEWARAFTWDARRTITQTYKERISQSMGFADQFREGFTREQFTNYLNTIEAQASFILSGEDDVQTPLIQSIPHSPDLPGSMPTYTLSPDNLLALLETQRGQSELCQQVNVWTQRHTGGVRDHSGIKTTQTHVIMRCLLP